MATAVFSRTSENLQNSKRVVPKSRRCTWNRHLVLLISFSTDWMGWLHCVSRFWFLLVSWIFSFEWSSFWRLHLLRFLRQCHLMCRCGRKMPFKWSYRLFCLAFPLSLEWNSDRRISLNICKTLLATNTCSLCKWKTHIILYLFM